MRSILTLNGGSSSVKFALFQVDEPLKPALKGMVERSGLSGTNLSFNNLTDNRQGSESIPVSDHESATNFLLTGWRSWTVLLHSQQ